MQSSASEQLEKKTAQLASELYVPIVEPSSLHVSMTDSHRDCGGNSASVRSRAAALETELGDTKVRQAVDPCSLRCGMSWSCGCCGDAVVLERALVIPLPWLHLQGRAETAEEKM
jgi:hypothetical protein